jgi:hypothetical protein
MKAGRIILLVVLLVAIGVPTAAYWHFCLPKVAHGTC